MLTGRVKTDTTDAISFYFSHWLHEAAEKNVDTHFFKDVDFGLRMSFKNAPVGFTTMRNSLVLTYGFGPIKWFIYLIISYFQFIIIIKIILV